MSRRGRLRLAALVAVVAAIGIVVLAVYFSSRGGGGTGLPRGLRTRAAGAPFAGYRETSIEVDGRCRLIAVADTEPLREEGLRGHANVGGYAGMLFAFDGESDASFTMAGVSQPLEIGWYSSDGKRISGAHMAPCPDGVAADCPIYSAGQRYRVALERPGGSSSVGQLTPC